MEMNMHICDFYLFYDKLKKKGSFYFNVKQSAKQIHCGNISKINCKEEYRWKFHVEQQYYEWIFSITSFPLLRSDDVTTDTIDVNRNKRGFIGISTICEHQRCPGHRCEWKKEKRRKGPIMREESMIEETMKIVERRENYRHTVFYFVI